MGLSLISARTLFRNSDALLLGNTTVTVCKSSPYLFSRSCATLYRKLFIIPLQSCLV